MGVSLKNRKRKPFNPRFAFFFCPLLLEECWYFDGSGTIERQELKKKCKLQGHVIFFIACTFFSAPAFALRLTVLNNLKPGCKTCGFAGGLGFVFISLNRLCGGEPRRLKHVLKKSKKQRKKKKNQKQG